MISAFAFLQKKWTSTPSVVPTMTLQTEITVPPKLALLIGSGPHDIATRADQELVDYSGNDPEGYVRLLIERDKSTEVLAFLAYGLPEHAAVKWATECYTLQGKQRSAPDHTAYVSAQTWVASPSSEHQSAVAKDALNSGHNGPGGWAAQGAAWAKPVTGSNFGVPPDPLVGKAVLGSVMLSAAMTRPDIELPKAIKLAERLKELEAAALAKNPTALVPELGKEAITSTKQAAAALIPPPEVLKAQALAAAKLPASITVPQLLDPKAVALQKVTGLMSTSEIARPLTEAGAIAGLGSKITPPEIAAKAQLLASGKIELQTASSAATEAGSLPVASIPVLTLEERKRQLEMYRPFIERGLAIAAGA